MMNKQKGNMYTDVTHTWNGIKGKCPHNCSYCYMRGFRVGELRLDEKSLEDNLGKGNIIFVGSSTDMWAEKVPSEWIERVLEHCRNFDNKYLFQSKNPKRFKEFRGKFPEKTILGTTIETNRNYMVSDAPSPAHRYIDMPYFTDIMISIEPIMDFDMKTFLTWIRILKPKYVSIGADSKGHKLPEPDKDTLKRFIRKLKKITEVKPKSNLGRLLR